MKNIFTLMCWLLCASTITVAQNNPDFESSTPQDYNGWITQGGSTYNHPVNLLVSPDTGTGIFGTAIPNGLMTGGTYFGVETVYEGAQSFRIGSTQNASETNAVYYKFTVTPDNAEFSFRYACFLTDGGHEPDQNPYFRWFMGFVHGGTTITKPHLPFGSSHAFDSYEYQLFAKTSNTIIADVNNPFFEVRGETAIKQWTKVCYDLTPFIGQEVYIQYSVTGCSAVEHGAIAYIDALFDTTATTAEMTLNQTSFCVGSNNTFIDASASHGEDRYNLQFAKITYLNWWTGDIQFGETRGSGWKYGATAPDEISVESEWAKWGGGSLDCDSWYAARLITGNACSEYDTTFTIFITHPCAYVDAGPDQEQCCDGWVILGDYRTPGDPNTTYTWKSYPDQQVATAPEYPKAALAAPRTTSYFTITGTTTDGCTMTDGALVYVKTSFWAEIDHYNEDFSKLNAGDCESSNDKRTNPAGCGNGYLEVETDRNRCEGYEGDSPYEAFGIKYTYLWNTGETTSRIIPRSGITDYSCVVTNGKCESVTAYYTIPFSPSDFYNVALNKQLQAFHYITPTLPLPSGVPILHVFDRAMMEGEGPAYNAYRYRFRIFDRNGSIVNCSEGVVSDPNVGFANGVIQWDGTTSSGNLVPGGVYIGQVTLWSCATEDKGTSNFRILRSDKTVRKCTGPMRWKWFWSSSSMQFLPYFERRDCADGPDDDEAISFEIQVVY